MARVGSSGVQTIELGTDNTPAGAQAKVEATVTSDQGVRPPPSATA